MTSEPFTSNCIQSTHVVPASFPRNPITVHDPNAHLHLSVDEYTIQSSERGGITLVFTHGTSFNKKLWEPTIWRLLRGLQQGKSRGCVKKILAIDASNHGESWMLNEKKLTRTSHWPDQSKDILQVLRYFNAQQPIIGIGHSFGGGILAHAAMMDPSAFFATIFVDPILFQMKDQTRMIAERALKRRDQWDSLNDVQKSFGQNKGFNDWNQEVLNLHIEHSTRDFVEGNRTSRILKTPKEQEAATYLAAPFPELPDRLATSEQKHYFILGGKSVVVHPADREWMKSISKGSERVTIMEGAGHLIPMTHPDALAVQLQAILEMNFSTKRGGEASVNHIRSSL